MKRHLDYPSDWDSLRDSETEWLRRTHVIQRPADSGDPLESDDKSSSDILLDWERTPNSEESNNIPKSGKPTTNKDGCQMTHLNQMNRQNQKTLLM